MIIEYNEGLCYCEQSDEAGQSKYWEDISLKHNLDPLRSKAESLLKYIPKDLQKLYKQRVSGLTFEKLCRIYDKAPNSINHRMVKLANLLKFLVDYQDRYGLPCLRSLGKEERAYIAHVNMKEASRQLGSTSETLVKRIKARGNLFVLTYIDFVKTMNKSDS